MRQVKEKCPGTAATVQSTSDIYRIQNSTVQAPCKAPLGIDDRRLGVFGEILEVAELHHHDGFHGEPFCSKRTYAGLVASHAVPSDDSERIKNVFSVIDAIFYESWERGRADATAGKYAREALRDEFVIRQEAQL